MPPLLRSMTNCRCRQRYRQTMELADKIQKQLHYIWSLPISEWEKYNHKILETQYKEAWHELAWLSSKAKTNRLHECISENWKPPSENKTNDYCLKPVSFSHPVITHM